MPCEQNKVWRSGQVIKLSSCKCELESKSERRASEQARERERERERESESYHLSHSLLTFQVTPYHCFHNPQNTQKHKMDYPK